MGVKKLIAVCKLIDAHAAIQDSTKHVNMQVEPRLQTKKKEEDSAFVIV